MASKDRSQAEVGEATRDASSAQDINSRFLHACLDSMHAAAKAQLTLQQQAARAYSEFQETVSDLQRQLQDRSVEAFQTFADDLGAIARGGDAYDKCREAYDNYLDGMRQLAATQSDAER